MTFGVRVRSVYKSRWRMCWAWLKGRRDMFWHTPTAEEMERLR